MENTMETVGEQWHILTTKEMLAISSNPPGKSKFDPIVVHYGNRFLGPWPKKAAETILIGLTRIFQLEKSSSQI